MNVKSKMINRDGVRDIRCSHHERLKAIGRELSHGRCCDVCGHGACALGIATFYARVSE